MGFDDFKGETPVWYWITFIPQLLTGLCHKEAPAIYQILLSIAKSYPQALYFQASDQPRGHESHKEEPGGQGASPSTARPVNCFQWQAKPVASQAKTEPPKTSDGGASRPGTATEGDAASQVKTEGGDAAAAAASVPPSSSRQWTEARAATTCSKPKPEEDALGAHRGDHVCPQDSLPSTCPINGDHGGPDSETLQVPTR
ncbi:transcription-associated protein 1 [Metarhizium acridum]|nr:transcription-associated protein 1 [Metarhizium acridum]